MPIHEGPAKGGATVLVADDSEAIRTRLTALIRHVLGVSKVVSASGAEEAMIQLVREHPRVALVDVHLGDGRGDLLRWIKREHPETLLVALMRYPVPQVAAVYRVHGADFCFDKTTELEAIVRVVAEQTAPRGGSGGAGVDGKQRSQEK